MIATGRCRHRFHEVLVVTALLAAHLVLAFTATLDATPTYDEILHLASGVAYWRSGDYRLQPENGNLPQRWCALPVLLFNPHIPEDTADWRAADAMRIGRGLLYRSEDSAKRLVASARCASMAWSVALCLTVFLWSRSLFGFGGGVVSLALAAFWPAVVAHGPLATSDVCGAVCFTLAAWSLWQVLNQVTGRTLAAAAAAVGLAAIAKHSSVLLAPVAVAFLVAILASGKPLDVHLGGWRTTATSLPARTGLALTSLAVPLAAAAGCIWASCGFRYLPTAEHVSGLRYYWFATLAECVGHAGTIGTLCEWLAGFRLLPEAWLWGMSYVAARSSHRYAFAIGEHSIHGWWWFFPLCLAIKNTLPALALCGWGVARQVAEIVAALRARLPLRGELWGSVPLVIMLAVLWPFFLSSHLNIGERHLLPSYPPLMILAGGTWRAATSRWLKGLVVLLLGLHALDVASHWPATLAYFNQIVPRGRAHEWLVDSSLDWGQDLDRLAAWLERNRRPDEPAYVTYFGGARPDTALADFELLGLPPEWGVRQSFSPGLYCVSATALQGVADRPRGRWCQTFERDYQAAAAWLTRHESAPDAPQADASARQLLAAITRDRDELGVLSLGTPPSDGALAVAAFNILQAGRLKAFLRHRPPDTVIGGSILVFRLDATEIERALHGPPAELDDQSWFERERYGTADELVRQGRRHLDEERANQAVVTFESATRLYPGDPRAWDGLAVACQSLGDDDRAMRAERRCELIRARLAAGEAER
jgi:hypothetical protein